MKEKMMKYARICERAEGGSRRRISGCLSQGSRGHKKGGRMGSTCGGIAATGFIN